MSEEMHGDAEEGEDADTGVSDGVARREPWLDDTEWIMHQRKILELKDKKRGLLERATFLAEEIRIANVQQDKQRRNKAGHRKKMVGGQIQATTNGIAAAKLAARRREEILLAKEHKSDLNESDVGEALFALRRIIKRLVRAGQVELSIEDQEQLDRAEEVLGIRKHKRSE